MRPLCLSNYPYMPNWLKSVKTGLGRYCELSVR